MVRKGGKILLTLVLAGMLASPAFAQKSTLEQDELLEERIIENIVRPKDDGYVSPNFENLSRLYWAIGKFDLDDTKAIDNFLKINECELYMRFYHNDFEWNEVQKATKKHIESNLSKFPTHFEMVYPISLGRYDIEKEVFDVAEHSKVLGMQRIEFAMNYDNPGEDCVHSLEVEGYPSNLIVILNRPLYVEKVPVKEELAKLYLEEAKRFYEGLPPAMQLRKYERLAFLRLKIRVMQYKNTIRVENGRLRAVVFARLEGYEIYADPEKLKPLYIKDMKDKRFRRLRRNPEDYMAGGPVPPEGSGAVEEQPGNKEESPEAAEPAGQ